MTANACPVPNTHKRLLEIHRLIHQCQENYFDPEGFRTNLNATIQAIRNLTFALQNEKDSIVNFDDWYKNWQNKMKADEILQWLNKSRVKIVHQKDLETKSIIKVTIKNYLDIFQVEFNLPPFFPTEIIGSACVEFLSKKYPNKEIKECYAIVERRWIESELPNWELLDALTYGFKFLYQLVIDAHEKVALNINNCIINDSLHHLSEEEVLTGDLVCINKEQTYRIETVSLSDFATISFDMEEVEFEEDVARKALSRYKIDESSFNTNENLYEFAKMCNEFARKILVKDKVHRRMFLLHSPSGKWELIEAEAEDKTRKFILMSEIAKIVKSKKIDAVIHIAEAWVSRDVDSIAKGIPVSESKGKREVLIVTLLEKNKGEIIFTNSFKRGLFGNIILSETEISINEESTYLSPIKKAWDEI